MDGIISRFDPNARSAGRPQRVQQISGVLQMDVRALMLHLRAGTGDRETLDGGGRDLLDTARPVVIGGTGIPSHLITPEEGGVVPLAIRLQVLEGEDDPAAVLTPRWNPAADRGLLAAPGVILEPARKRVPGAAIETFHVCHQVVEGHARYGMACPEGPRDHLDHMAGPDLGVEQKGPVFQRALARIPDPRDLKIESQILPG